jgi:hypothetical protein
MIVPMHKYRGTLEVKHPNNGKNVVELVNMESLISRETLKQRVLFEGIYRKRIRFYN